MKIAPKYLWAALVCAVLAHALVILATPLVLMNVAMSRVSEGSYNHWRLAPRVTEASRTIVRPSPDFAYSACVYDLATGPVVIRTAPWDAYWSLSLYADNSDNFYVIGDREARPGADITLTRDARVEDAANAVRSPSRRGIALIRRLAPTPEAYAAVARIADEDVCATLAHTAR
ncbi:MAG: DUF1254 domain-containing protein [Hyphomonadaceae bacterium]|nr:DUF1254 domain-containing protein [Hyphomonadaceae bacterium]